MLSGAHLLNEEKVYTNCNMEQTKKIDETKVFIVGCKNEELLKKVNALAEAEGVQLVVLEDRVVSDYVASHQEPTAENEADKLQQFLTNKSNYNEAEAKALSLFNMLTKNGDIAKSEEMVFGEVQVTKATNLSYSKADDLLELLRLFGIVEYVSTKKPITFRFHFGEETRQNCVMIDISEDCALIKTDMERYIASVNRSTATDAEKQAKIDQMKEVVSKSLA